mmetsp:Transcript_11770/g.45920  ORF Transcript_11770/g.45920 Transcript_11770/m.45920 type:complete len:324 (+) Transcript_11770:287-1258(+)
MPWPWSWRRCWSESASAFASGRLRAARQAAERAARETAPSLAAAGGGSRRYTCAAGRYASASSGSGPTPGRGRRRQQSVWAPRPRRRLRMPPTGSSLLWRAAGGAGARAPGGPVERRTRLWGAGADPSCVQAQARRRMWSTLRPRSGAWSRRRTRRCWARAARQAMRARPRRHVQARCPPRRQERRTGSTAPTGGGCRTTRRPRRRPWGQARLAPVASTTKPARGCLLQMQALGGRVLRRAPLQLASARKTDFTTPTGRGHAGRISASLMPTATGCFTTEAAGTTPPGTTGRLLARTPTAGGTTRGLRMGRRRATVHMAREAA